MPEERHGRSRVLLGDLGPVACVGMRELASERGAAVVGEQHSDEAVVAEAARLQPDTVVLPLDAGPCRLLAARIRAAAPATKLIFWPRDEAVVEVLDRHSTVRRRIAKSAVQALSRELSATRSTPDRGAACPRT